jgi:predicted RNA-binding protein with EMAP domain
MGKLTVAQLDFIEKRRVELAEEELKIRRIPEKERYGNENGNDYSRRMIAIFDEHRFFNHMIQLHNVEAKAEKAAAVAAKVGEVV